MSQDHDLRARVAKLERDFGGSSQELIIQLAVDQVLQMLSDNAEEHIPNLTLLQAEFKAFKRHAETELKQLKTNGGGGGHSTSHVSAGGEDMSRIELDNLRRSVAQVDSALSDRIQQLHKMLEMGLDKLYEKIQPKEIHSRIDFVENRLLNYITQERFNALQEQLIEFATNDTVEHIILKINKLDERFISHAQYEGISQDMLNAVDVKIADRVGFKELNEGLMNLDNDQVKRFDQVQKSQDSLKKTLKKLQNQFHEVVDVTNSQSELLKQKVDFDEIERLWKNFEKFCMYDDLKDLYMKTVPEIFKFEQKIEDHRREIEKQTEILRRFDEIISEKSSKTHIREVQAEIAKKYALVDDFNSHKTMINEKVENNHESINNLQEMIDLLGKTITKDIFSAVKKATSHLQGRINQQSSGAQASTQLADEIKLIVACKADLETVSELNSKKANKIDTEIAMRWIEVINRQLKQIIVLITEILRFEVEKKELKMFEGEQHIEQSKAFLLQQALLISQWINRFHTQSVNEYFLESSNGINELNWTPPEIAMFQKYAEDKLQGIDLDVLIARNNNLAQNIKMRSKSVVQGGATLSQTQTNFNKSKNPSNGLSTIQVTPRTNNAKAASLVNNKVHYLGMPSPATASASQGEYISAPPKMRKQRANSGIRTLNIESDAQFGLRVDVPPNLLTGYSHHQHQQSVAAPDSLRNQSIILDRSSAKQIYTTSNIKVQKAGQRGSSLLNASGMSTKYGVGFPTQTTADKHMKVASDMHLFGGKDFQISASAQKPLRQSLNLPGILSPHKEEE